MSITESLAYRFRNATAFINESLAVTQAENFVDLGGWYGTLSSNINAPSGRHLVFEAVRQIFDQQVLPENVERLCRVVCRPERYRSFFNVVPTNTINTSGLGTQASPHTIEMATGELLSINDFLDQYKYLLLNGGIKMNIEGEDLYVLQAMIQKSVWPKFIVAEIWEDSIENWLTNVWPEWQQRYQLVLNPLVVTTVKKSFHIAVRQGKVFWWYIPSFPPARAPLYSCV